MAESSILTADCRSSTNVLCKNFKLGEPVLFCDCWGDICNTDKLYYWGELRAGFITGIEPIGVHLLDLYAPASYPSRCLQMHNIHLRME